MARMGVFPRLSALTCAVAVALAARSPLEAQDAPPAPLTVAVRQVAGNTLYLDIGTDQGLATGDTLAVELADDAATSGVVVVTASTPTRAVLSFVGPPLDVLRGSAIVLHMVRAARVAPKVDTRPTTPAAESPEPAERSSPVASSPAHGRWSLDLAASHSTTQVGRTDPESVDRTFATPALRFDVTVPDAVGGFELRTSARVAYRYAAQDASLLRPTSVRVYEAALDRRFTSLPLRLTLGRFYSPAESYSGFWDGLMVRYGPESLGVGFLVGFQPDRWNETPSGELPKASVFVDTERRGRDWRWRADLSAHTVRPTTDLNGHTFLGLSQRIAAGPFRLSQDLQVDRDPDDGSWKVSELRMRSTVRLSPVVDLRVGVARDERYRLWTLSETFGPRRDRVDGGLGFRLGGAYLGLDASASRQEDGRTSWGSTTSLSAPPRGSGLGFAGSASFWSNEDGRVISAAPALLFGLGRARMRLGYRFYRADYPTYVSTTHAGELSADAPLATGLRLSARLRSQWGGGLRGQYLSLSLSRTF